MVREEIVAVLEVPAPPVREPNTVDALGAQIIGMAGRLASAKCRWLLLLARFDECQGHAQYGLATTARWVGHYCGISLRTAVEYVRVARALAQFTDLAEAMRAGRLSYSHVRAISRVAHTDEQALVAELIEVAEHGTISQLEVMVRGLRTVENNERARADGARPDEYVTNGWTDQAQWRQAARLDPERGALVQRVIESIARAENLDLADALVRMAEIALTAMNDRAKPPRPVRGDERAAVVVHVTAADLGTEPRSTERSALDLRRPAGRIASGPGLPQEVLTRLMCAGQIRSVIHNPNGKICDLGRSRRVVSNRLFRALWLRDSGHCTHPGCASAKNLEAHHVRHWLWGGRTDLANLVLLCERHHHAHHAGEFSIAAPGRGRFMFRRADGVELTRHVDPSGQVAAVARIEDDTDYALVAADAAMTRWRGEPLQRQWAVSVLADRRQHTRVDRAS